MVHDWVIKVKVMNKQLRHWNNAKGPGTTLSLELMDECGTMIQCSCFNQTANKFNE